MSEQNKTMVRRYFDEMLNTNNFGLMDEFLTADFSMVDAAIPMPIVGHAGFEMVQKVMYSAFPDLQIEVGKLWPKTIASSPFQM